MKELIIVFLPSRNRQDWIDTKADLEAPFLDAPGGGKSVSDWRSHTYAVFVLTFPDIRHAFRIQ
jgi:hypothetical protein